MPAESAHLRRHDLMIVTTLGVELANMGPSLQLRYVNEFASLFRLRQNMNSKQMSVDAEAIS